MPAAIERAGFVRIAPALAQRGDLVQVGPGPDLALALCLGDMAAAPGFDGLIMVDVQRAEAAWRV